MKAYHLQSGSERWVVRDLPAVNRGSPVASKDMLYFVGSSSAGEDAPMPDYSALLKADANSDGKISEAESENTTLKGFFKPNDPDKEDFKQRVAATPATAGDTLYVRTETKLFELKGAKWPHLYRLAARRLGHADEVSLPRR